MTAAKPETRPRAIVDIESSGLGPESWPVSIAWHILESCAEGHLLIKPAATWHGWQEEAEEIHGISRARLKREGMAPADAARDRMGTRRSRRPLGRSGPRPELDGQDLRRGRLASRPGHPALRRLVSG